MSKIEKIWVDGFFLDKNLKNEKLVKGNDLLYKNIKGNELGLKIINDLFSFIEIVFEDKNV